MSNLSTLPKGDSAWLLRKAIQRIIQQVSVLETNIGSSTTGNSNSGEVIFNDAGVLRGDSGLTFNSTTDTLRAGLLIVPGNTQLATVGILYVGSLGSPKLKVDVAGTGETTIASATITGDLTVRTNKLAVTSTGVGFGTTSPAYTLEVVAPAGNNIVSTFRSGDATAANNAGGGFQSISSATAASRVARVWLDADGSDLSGGDYFFIQKNGSSGTVEFNQSSNAAMTFLTNGTERMRIDSSGNVGVGVAPSGAFYSGDETRVVVKGFSPNYAGTFGVESKGTSNSTRGFFTAADSINEIGFGSVTNSRIGFYANGALKAALNTNGHLTVVNGNVILGTSGTGIDFSATPDGSGTMTSELLNDYEEGTWTIGIAFGGASTGITYSQNTGKYTKVGRLVTVFGAVDLTNKGSATGNASITGLPFSIGGASSDYSAASLQLVNITFADFPMGFGNPTTTTIPLQEVTNAGVRTNLTDADFANNSAIIFSLTYSV